jgi:hypothetical protein
MTFTVVRAVRGSELTATEPSDKRQRLVQTAPPSIFAAAMDLPHFEEVLHLNLVSLAGIPSARGANLSMNAFARTIPSALE